MAADPRTTPIRDGKVYAEDGQTFHVLASEAPLLSGPRHDAGRLTTLHFGTTVTVFDTEEGYSWCQSKFDGYVGWVADSALMVGPLDATHRVKGFASHIYREPDIKAPTLYTLSMGARLQVDRIKDNWAILANYTGAVPIGHCAPLSHTGTDPVSAATQFLGVPYLWGGNCGWGIDCSGLVQVAFDACGNPCPRDSDMQMAQLGHDISLADGLQRGDLIFWKGHVGMMTDAKTLVHANAHHMMVALEPVQDAIDRIAKSEFGNVIGVKRP